MMQYAEVTWRMPPVLWNQLLLENQDGSNAGARKGGVEASSDRSDNQPQPATRVLVVDDEPLIADTLKRILNLNGFVADAVYSGEEAIAALPSMCPDIVLTDVRMPGRNGIETGILIRNSCPDTRVVLFSGQAGVSDLMDEARRKGYGFDLWPKPIHPRELVKRLRAL